MPNRGRKCTQPGRQCGCAGTAPHCGRLGSDIHRGRVMEDGCLKKKGEGPIENKDTYNKCELIH